MAIPVSSGALNLSASGASPDASRSAANAMLELSFSDLLRGQIQDGFNTRTPETSPLPNARPASTSTRTPPETPRTPDDSSSSASRPSRPSQESACAQNNPTESGQAVKRPTETQDATPTSQQENTVTGKSASEKTPENIAPHTLQPPLIDTAISPDLPATIAALLLGIAGEITEDALDTSPETFTRSAPTHTTHPRHPTMTDISSARIAAPADMQESADVESHADSNPGTNQNTSAAFTGHASRHSAPTIAPTLQGQSTVPDMIMNAANATSMSLSPCEVSPCEDGSIRIAPVTTNTGDISMLNPPRLPAQAGAVLPQFTIPTGAGQRAWAEEIGNRVMWMLGRAESRAELILTPPLLGKVEVSIHLNGDQSMAQFLASSQSAREALEQAMPRLRELLAQAGITLGETSVNTSAEDRTQDGESTHRTGAHTLDVHDGDGDADATAITVPHWSRLNNGLIDTFA